MFRTRDIGSALQSWSKDGGVTWGNSSVSQLHNPNSRVRSPLSNLGGGSPQFCLLR